MNTRLMAFGSSVSKSILLGMSIGLALTVNGFGQTISCAASSKSRQLDYWLGDWKIGADGSAANAHSTVSLSLDKCLVVENWDGGRGHSGQNIFGYSADDDSWYGFLPTMKAGFTCSHRGKSREAQPNLKVRAADQTAQRY